MDISAVMGDIEALLNRSIAAEGYTMPVSDPARCIDLSQVDFDRLKQQFEEGRKNIEAQRLRARVEARLAEMVQRNRTRINLLEEFQKRGSRRTRCQGAEAPPVQPLPAA